MMNDPFHSNNLANRADAVPLDNVLDMCGLRTVAALAVEMAIANPLAAQCETLVIQADLQGKDEEFNLVRLAMASSRDAVCLLGSDKVEGTGTLLVVQSSEEGAWIGYCRAFADSATA